LCRRVISSSFFRSFCPPEDFDIFGANEGHNAKFYGDVSLSESGLLFKIGLLFLLLLTLRSLAGVRSGGFFEDFLAHGDISIQQRDIALIIVAADAVILPVAEVIIIQSAYCRQPRTFAKQRLPDRRS
jgi:hypothetical protein